MTGRELSNRRSDRAGDANAAGVGKVVRENLDTLREQAGEQASVLTQALRERSENLFQEQKSRAAAEIMHFGAAVRRAADKLHDQHSDSLAGYVDTAAASLDGVARYVEENDLADLAREVERFARQRPALIVGGMFLAGLAVGRFVKAGQAAPAQPGRRARENERSRANSPDEPRGGRAARRNRASSRRPRKA